MTCGLNILQLAWRPSPEPDSVPEALVLTTKGQLLLGRLGAPLQPFHEAAVEGSVNVAAWSTNGSQLAIAVENTVVVQDMQSGTHFTAQFDSQVLPSRSVLVDDAVIERV